MSAVAANALATLRGRLTTTVGRELLVGVTGLALVGFVVAHLAGNLLIYAGPEAINAYSRALHNLGELLWVARIGLITVFVVHIGPPFPSRAPTAPPVPRPTKARCTAAPRPSPRA
jgi:hypothetical protein